MPPSAKAAAAWSSTVKVAVVVCERLEEFGSLAVNAIVLTPRLVEVAETVQGWLAAGGQAARAGGDCPQRGAAALDRCAERVVQVVCAGDGEGKDVAVAAAASRTVIPYKVELVAEFVTVAPNVRRSAADDRGIDRRRPSRRRRRRPPSDRHGDLRRDMPRRCR